jgi:porin
VADGDTTQVDWDYTAGIVANGWVPTRPEGEIGLGISQAHNGDRYMTAQAGAADRNEYSYELYYRDRMCKGVSLQPDAQFVVNPGTDNTTHDALVLGARLDVAF